MRFDHIHPFTEAATETLSRVIGESVQHGALTLKNSPFSGNRGVVAVIDLTGSLAGRVIFDMDVVTAQRLAGALNGEEFNSMSAIVLDTVGELANMMVGKAITTLHREGFSFEVAPAQVMNQKKSEFTEMDPMETLVIPVSTQFGDVGLNVALTIENQNV